MKIAIVGDTHITEYVRERTDDYLTAVLKKLEYVAKNADKVIILGDLFDKPTNSDYLFYRVFSLMKRHEGKFMSLIGNHDIINRNYEQLNKTTIGSLAKTGVLHLLTEDFTLDGQDFVVSFCERSKREIPVDETNEKILLGHNYYEMDPDESFTRQDLCKLKYNLVFLGHDHQPHGEEAVGESLLVRLGSLARKDTSAYNKDRKIQFALYDTCKKEYMIETIPDTVALPSNKVFSMDSFTRKKVDRPVVDYSQIGKLLEKFTRQDLSSISLNEVLVRIGAPKECREYIKGMHEVSGLKYT